ncbi:MAG: O-antigen ligase family protein [Clostridia bacterium]|nr:O-antigen ligase family protein [Clostridia bacterium]
MQKTFIEEKKLNINVKNALSVLFFVAFLLFSVYYYFGEDRTIWLFFFGFNWKHLSLVCFIVAIILQSFNKTVKADAVVFLFIIRALVSLLNANATDKLGEGLAQETISVYACLSYLFTFNCVDKPEEKIKTLFTYTSLILSLQIFICILFNGLDKNYIYAGFGKSNYVATFILGFTVVIAFMETTLFQKIVIVINLLALLFIQSFGAYIGLLVVLIAFLITKIKWNKKTLLRTVIIALSLIVLLCLFFLTRFGRPLYEKIATKIGYLKDGNLMDFGSSRLGLYKYSIESIKKNIWFGNIINENLSEINSRWLYFRTHNFFLESLLLYGVIGTIVNGALMGFVIYRLIKIPKSSFKTAVIWAFIAYLCHGLVEPNFFTLVFGIFFWGLMGACLSVPDKNDYKSLIIKYSGGFIIV